MDLKLLILWKLARFGVIICNVTRHEKMSELYIKLIYKESIKEGQNYIVTFS
ncbi:MAG: hypothetical protein K0S01_1072 [Herbinix sp.]|jgi:hypothetical protein|nr:hypothetical protein [Herbinix sp.]